VPDEMALGTQAIAAALAGWPEAHVISSPGPSTSSSPRPSNCPFWKVPDA
jgi:hypothetical protein